MWKADRTERNKPPVIDLFTEMILKREMRRYQIEHTLDLRREMINPEAFAAAFQYSKRGAKLLVISGSKDTLR